MPDAGFPESRHQCPTQSAGPSLNTGLRATQIEKSGWRGARLTTDHRSLGALAHVDDTEEHA